MTGLEAKTSKTLRTPPKPRSEEGSCLPEVYISSNESFDQSLKRFNKLVQQSGILAEARRREHYEPPSVYRKKKAAAKRRKSLKNAQRG